MSRARLSPSHSSDSYGGAEEKRNTRRFSRSRSPDIVFKQQDFQKTRAKLSAANEELHEKKNDLLEERKKLLADIKEVKKTIEALRTSLETIKSNAVIFLPCSHQKIVNIKHKQLLDNTFEKALERLNESELKNEILLRQTRAKIFYALEAKFPDVFKCSHPEKFTNEVCGHINTAGCYEIKRYIKNAKWPVCCAAVDYRFECGHLEVIECNLRGSTKCSKCLNI